MGLVAVRSGSAADMADTLTGVVEGASRPVPTVDIAVDADAGGEGSAPARGVPRWPWESYDDVFTVTTKTGAVRTFKQGRGGAYRPTNWEIGRAAEAAGVQIASVKKDRFVARRKRTAEKARTALMKSIQGKKKKAKVTGAQKSAKAA